MVAAKEEINPTCAVLSKQTLTRAIVVIPIKYSEERNGQKQTTFLCSLDLSFQSSVVPSFRGYLVIFGRVRFFFLFFLSLFQRSAPWLAELFTELAMAE